MFGPRWAGHRFATFELPQWLPDWWGFFVLDYCAEKIGNKNMKLEKINLLANKMFLDLLKTKRGVSCLKQYLQLISQGVCLSHPVSSLPEDLTSADGKISS